MVCCNGVLQFGKSCMPRKAKVMALSLTDETRSTLCVLARPRTAARSSCRAVGDHPALGQSAQRQ
jgi:hypothetical protein